MAPPPRIALATKNEHKLVEITRICSDWPVEWVTVRDRDPGTFPDVDETGDTYLDNASLKARAVADALSARFAGQDATDERNLAELIRSIRGIPAAGLTARYRCVAASAAPGGELVSAEGLCEGTLTTRPRGSGGFGYDPIFVPVGWDRTMAELEPDEKDRISHRGRAFRALRALLSDI